MYGEFTGACAHYYRLNQRLEKQQLHFNTLLQNALPYNGQTSLGDLDDIIRCNREVQKTLADTEETQTRLRQAEATIIKMMQYFEIPPNTKLIGAIEGELEFEIWASENDTLYINKTKDLDPPIENPNIITIWFSDDRYGV